MNQFEIKITHDLKSDIYIYIYIYGMTHDYLSVNHIRIFHESIHVLDACRNNKEAYTVR